MPGRYSRFEFLIALPQRKKGDEALERGGLETVVADPGGTESSNPSSSSGESVSLPELLSRVENPGFPRGCARWLGDRVGRDAQGCYKIAPTDGNISVAPYSSTAVPLMWWWRECHAGANEVGASPGSTWVGL